MPLERQLEPPVANAGPDFEILVAKEATFDGGGSYDPDGSIAAYDWDFGDGSAASGSVAYHAFAPPGVYTVMLMVTDDDGLTGVDYAEVTVLTPVQGIEDVVETIDALLASGELTEPTARSLTRKLGQAHDLLTQGSTNAAINKLGDFVDQVDALVRSGRLAAAEGDALKQATQDLIDAINATSP